MSPLLVLVAYGSDNGSTAGIADMIAVALRDAGLAAHTSPAAQVHTVDGYDAVIIGGAIYNGRWHVDARTFARRHETALRGRPVYVFSSGPLDTSADTADIPPVRHAADAVRRLAAREHVTFGGRLTDQAKGFTARAMVRNGRGGDFRNPARVGAWAAQIAAQLQQGLRPGPDLS
ncbi:flavodoxin domain-containing protein [Catellatospora citrea]|uniref:flavodoxin domain-containing protein n=1 Tax=Catellatospora citrea TaxID=53366 RepID=UPI0034082F36